MHISATTECAAIGSTQKPSSDLLKRSLVAIPALLLLASVIYIHDLYAKIVVLVVHIICVHELLDAIAAIASPLRSLSYGFAGSLFLVYAFLGGQSLVSSLLAISLMLVFLVLMICQRKVSDGLYTAFTMLYPGILFASVYDILSLPNIQISRFLLILAFGCAIVTDTFAYLGGSLLGRHKLIERISPHKTVEGALCGLVFSLRIAFSVVIWHTIESFSLHRMGGFVVFVCADWRSVRILLKALVWYQGLRKSLGSARGYARSFRQYALYCPHREHF